MPPAPEAKFKVLEQSQANELERIKKTAANSPLTLGVLYAQAGLLNDAEREFETLLKPIHNLPSRASYGAASKKIEEQRIRSETFFSSSSLKMAAP